MDRTVDLYLTSVCTSSDHDELHSRYLHYVVSKTQEEARALASSWWNNLKEPYQLDCFDFETVFDGQGIVTTSDILLQVSPDYMVAGSVAIKVESCYIALGHDDKEYIYIYGHAPLLTVYPPHKGVSQITHKDDSELYHPFVGPNALKTHFHKTGIVLLTGLIPTHINNMIGNEDVLFWREYQNPSKMATQWYNSHISKMSQILELIPFSHKWPNVFVTRAGGHIYGLKSINCIVAGPVKFRWTEATIYWDEDGYEYLQLPAFHNYIIPRQFSPYNQELFNMYHSSMAL